MNGVIRNRPDAAVARRQGDEGRLVTCLIQSVTEAGIAADPVDIIHLYVALKAKPLLLLGGPSETGKIAIIRCLAGLLTQNDPVRCQFLPGHAWWAAHSGNVALFTEAQTRWNTSKILALIEEAQAPENSERVYLVCLTRISPAEVHEFFVATAFQLRHGSLMRLPSAHFAEPVPFPPNLFVVGTLDGSLDVPRDDALLSQAAIVEWSGGLATPEAPVVSVSPPAEAERAFLRAVVRGQSAVERRLTHLPGWHEPVSTAADPLLALLASEGSHSLAALQAEVRVYLANAWSEDRRGLFALEAAANARLALDLTLEQLVRTHFGIEIRRLAALRRRLRQVAQIQLPRTYAWLEKQN